MEAVFAVLNNRPGIYGAKITWERREAAQGTASE